MTTPFSHLDPQRPLHLVAGPERAEHGLVFIGKPHRHRIHEAGDRFMMDRHMLEFFLDLLDHPFERVVGHDGPGAAAARRLGARPLPLAAVAPAAGAISAAARSRERRAKIIVRR